MRKSKGYLAPLDRRNDEPLGSFTTVSGRAERIGQWSEGKRIILLRIETGVPSDLGRGLNFRELAFGELSRYRGEGYVFDQPGNIWAELGQQPTFSFNCHSFSLGDRVGITPQDWVEGEPTDASLGTNPMEILLSHYFRQIKTFVLDERRYIGIGEDRDLRHDDVISFAQIKGKRGVVHLHSGRIYKPGNAGTNLILSKIRHGRLVAADILSILRAYPQTERMIVYRSKSDL